MMSANNTTWAMLQGPALALTETLKQNKPIITDITSDISTVYRSVEARVGCGGWFSDELNVVLASLTVICFSASPSFP